MIISKKGKELLKQKLLTSYEVDKNGCWIWTKSVTKRGYGTIMIEGINLYVHRAIFMLLKPNEYKEDLLVCHTCNVRRCINPAHLYAGTGSDNNRDAYASGGYESRIKTQCLYGHEYTPENTYIEPRSGNKRCKECLRARAKLRYRF